MAFDRSYLAWTGHGMPLAAVFTSSVLLPELASINVVGLLGGVLYRAWLPRSAFVVVLDLIAWMTSDAWKRFFHRARPPHWFFHHETSFSYSSGHAIHVMVVLGLWAIFFWRSTLPLLLRTLIIALLTCWIFAVSWSRLALGAHFASDVLGGWLLGAAIICAGFALYPIVLSLPSRKSDR